jgi:hypothetical protein
MRNCFFIFLLFISPLLFAQDKEPEMLLNNIRIQIECTEAIDAMYNFDFVTSEKQFLWLKQQYPEHPLPYFLLGLNSWWKIVPNDAVTIYDEDFFAYMDTTIEKAETLYDKNEENYEAAFFLAGAYAMKGRRYAEQGSYTKAAWVGKSALNYLNDGKENSENLSPEFLFGTGLYNFFREWIPEHKKYLKPMLLLFKKGNKEKGLEQLEKVSKQAFYTRIEAQYYLLDIYSHYEPGIENRRKGLKIAERLRTNYPNNPYFHRYYIKLLYDLRYGDKMEEEALDLLTRIDSSQVGYEAESGRVACYYLGLVNIYRYKRDKKEIDKATSIAYFMQYLDFAKEVDALEKGYTRRTYIELARFYKEDKNKKEALKYYELFLNADPPSKKHKFYKEAKKYIKENKEKKGWFW